MMEKPAINISKITAVLPVISVEPSAVFLEKIGFQRESEVPETPTDPTTPLGFVIMTSGDTQIMLQSVQSIQNDAPELLAGARPTTFLFMEVDDLDKIIAALDGYPVFMERRETFYGSKEIGIEDPSGHKYTFAQFNR